MSRLLIAVLVALAGCTTAGDTGGSTPSPEPTVAWSPALPPPPTAPGGPLEPVTVDALEHRFWLVGRPRPGDIERIASAGDVRLAWPLVDLLRFEQDSDDGHEAQRAIARLTGVPGDQLTEVAQRLGTDPTRPWVAYTDLLLAWDIPAPPDYLRYKAAQHRIFDQRWDPFFDPQADLDWRAVSWGGVPRDGIPDLVDPTTIPADEAGFLTGSDVVFGLQIEGAARAYPRRIMEVHEVVNDELGGVPIVLPFCTLCGVATAYLATPPGSGADVAGGPLEFGTSGLLLRSNKLMYDRQTESLFHQFTGRAVTGPLARADVVLERLQLTVTSWQQWRAAHPRTTVLALPEGADPSRYDGTFLRDLGGDTPAFPTGGSDPRLPAKTVVIGVDVPDGPPVAFPLDAARQALQAGRQVERRGVELRLEGREPVAVDAGGDRLPSRQAFWFAWSQFQPDTELWQETDRP